MLTKSISQQGARKVVVLAQTILIDPKPGIVSVNALFSTIPDWRNIASLTMSALSSTKLRTLLHALVKERHFALGENGRANQGSLRNHSGQELSPTHASLRFATANHDYYFELLS